MNVNYIQAILNEGWIENPNNKIKDKMFQPLAIFAYEKKVLLLEYDNLNKNKANYNNFKWYDWEVKFIRYSKEILKN